MISHDDMFMHAFQSKYRDEWDENDENNMEIDESEVKVVKLPTGGFHVCRGRNCAHVSVSITSTEKEFVCDITGLVVGVSVETNLDSSWTGRSVGSCDIDSTNAGCPTQPWRAKRDAFASSVGAWAKAKTINIEDVKCDDTSFKIPLPPTEAKLLKRGAPCVVETTRNFVQSERKERAVKRVVALQDHITMERLRKDASSVVSKLVTTSLENEDDSQNRRKTKEPQTPAAVESASLEDPRLQNFEFVFLIGIRRYLARCRKECIPPCLDTVLNTSIAASEFAKARQKAFKKKREGGLDKHAARAVVSNGQTIDNCAALICTLWIAVSATTPFKDAQFGESFRPFASGVLYALRQGVTLENGEGAEIEVIPKIPLIADHLPTLKSPNVSHTARQLQSASHKGICAIHRSIASVSELSDKEKTNALQKFNHAAVVGLKLLECVAHQVSIVNYSSS
tara:strand:- start:178 stop:1536 length:1359 start_codon:yes stop_codon:yes gene_type:complete